MKRALALFVLCAGLLGCSGTESTDWMVRSGDSTRLLAEFVALGVAPLELVVGCEAPRGSDGRLSSSASLRATLPDGQLDELLVALGKGEEVGGRDGWRDFNLPSSQPDAEGTSRSVFARFKGNRLVLFVGPDGSCAPSS